MRELNICKSISLILMCLCSFSAKANLKCKTTKNNVINSYKEDYFF